MNKIAAAAALLLGLTLVGTGSAQAADEVPGTSPGNPIVVTDPSEVPPGAVEDSESTYDTPEACDTTRSWVLTIPANEETSHQEFRYMREIPAVDEVSHLEWGVEERTRTSREVTDYKTQYHFAKFTRERTRTYTPGSPAVMSDGLWLNWSPNDTHGPQDYVPGYPTDSGPDGRPRGTWQHFGDGKDIPPGQQGPDGVYQNGGGNSSWFYREAPKVITPATEGGYGPWSEYGEWTKWSPETHTSWEDSDAPLGVPQFHSEGYTGNTHWQRQWQALFDGQTREVEIGTHTELGEWSPWAVTQSGLVVAPTLGENTNIREFRLVGPNRVVDVVGVPGYTEYFTGGEPSRDSADAIWLLAEQAPVGWTEFDERTVGNGDATPEVVTYYAYTDGAECEKPEGYENSSSTEECDNGDLVITETTETGTPVQAEDGSWTIEETATSSQSVKQDALKCAPDEPNPPKHNPTPPTVPTSVDAGLESVAPATDENTYLSSALVAGLAGMMVLVAAGMTVAHSRRRGTEK